MPLGRRAESSYQLQLELIFNNLTHKEELYPKQNKQKSKKKGNMATGGFKSNATTDFLEEWKAKREKMRAKMLGDIAAATGATGNANSSRTELNNNGNPDRSASTGNCLPSSYAVVRSASGTALKRPEEETHHPVAPTAAVTPGGNLKKAPPQMEKAQCTTPDSSSPMACNDSDKESPSPSKGKEKKSTGPSARKGKGQIEKRKLREKRRSTGVVSMPSNEVSHLFLTLLKKKKKNESTAGNQCSLFLWSRLGELFSMLDFRILRFWG